MNHFKKGGKVALLGENYFPPTNNSHMSIRRGKGLQKIMGTILHHKPSVMYICPTKGVNINLIPLIISYNIPLRLVFPSKSFFCTLTAEEKSILDAACSVADKVIILSQHRSDPLQWAEDWFTASKKAVDNSDWVLVASNLEEVTESFSGLLERFKGNTKPVLAVDFGEEAQCQ